jgi:hypothetical protein
VRAITGQLADTDALPACPMGHTGFYAYRGDVAAWARGAYDKKTPSDKTLVARSAVAKRVTALINHVSDMRAEYDAAQMSAQVAALTDAGLTSDDMVTSVDTVTSE